MNLLALFNIFLLGYTYNLFKKKQTEYSKTVFRIRRSHFILAAIYVFGCGFRSVLPREDLMRIVMVDSWISSIVIGRSVATIAELSFAAQWALILFEAGKGTNNRFALTTSKIIVPIIIIAECFSWYACTTTNYIGSSVEESLWAVAATITIIGFIKVRPHYINQQKKFLTAGIIVGLLYVCYMVFVDVPNYVNHWIHDEAMRKTYSSFGQGLIEVATQWTEIRTFEVWQYAMIWMTLYFSVAVWISLFIVNSPVLDKNIMRKVK